jgi:hypothetical protein
MNTEPSFLTATAQRGLVTSLERFHNALSLPHRKALYTLVESMTNMATGKLIGRYAFGLPTGTGKTRAIIEWSTAVSKLNLPYSLVVSASRIEALCTLKRDMIQNGIPADKIGLVYMPVYETDTKGKKKELKYSEPFTTGNESRPFLLCSHQLIRAREANLALYNTFNGQPRSLCIYDESLLVSDIEHFLVNELCASMSKWKDKFSNEEAEVDRTAILNWLNEQYAKLDFARKNYVDGDCNDLPPASFLLSPTDTQAYARYFRKEGEEALAEFVEISGLPLRVLRHGRTTVVSYRIVIPDQLKNMLVLDASYPIRKLERSDIHLINAETLPTCKAFKVSFDDLKRFDHVTINRMAHHGGRSSAVQNKTKMRRLLQDVVKVVQDIPQSEPVLIFVYKERFNRNPKRALELELEKVNLIDEHGKSDRLFIETWGNETSLNSYSHCKHVILVGILHRDLSELEAQHLGQTNNIKTRIDLLDLKAIALSERVHCAYQAFSRGACRVMSEPGQASTMTGYVIEYEEGFKEELEKVMPGATWKTWEPVYADTLAHGKLVLDLSSRVHAVLKTFPTGSRTATRKLKALCRAEGVDKNSWLRALNKATEENPQYILKDRSILVSAA